MVAVKNVLRIYEAASGEKIKFSKSAIMFSKKVNKDRREFLSGILGVRNVEEFWKIPWNPLCFF